MTDVQFSEEMTLAPAPMRTESGMVAWVIRSKWAKDQKQAEFLLMSVAVVAFATMMFVLIFGSAPSRSIQSTPLEQTIIPGEGGLPTGYAQ